MHKKKRRITHFFKGIGIALEGLTTVASRRGLHGEVAIFRHPELGKVFVLNGEIQHVEAWAALYHEPLVHLPTAFVRKPRDVLILGGGTLYAAAEALKYDSIRRVVLVDHDPAVTETVAEHYEHARACFRDQRFTVLHENAYAFVTNQREQFDLLINDGADLLAVKPGQTIAKSNMFSAMTRAIRPSGVCSDVIYRHLFDRRKTLQTLGRLRRRGRVALSLVFLPEYHGVLHVLCTWGRKSSCVAQSLDSPRNEQQLNWIRNPKSSPCVYYDPRFLHYYLHLPRYLKAALAVKRTGV